MRHDKVSGESPVALTRRERRPAMLALQTRALSLQTLGRFAERWACSRPE
jgi:hypothetical protein